MWLEGKDDADIETRRTRDLERALSLRHVRNFAFNNTPMRTASDLPVQLSPSAPNA
jgi:hypothetical protein